MILFLKALVIGIGKIVPGVSGAMLAINFNVYEKAINSITNFFDDWKNNLKFILIFGLGILLSIVFGSGIILHLLINYKFITMMFFIVLILGGTYNFARKVKYNYKNILLILIVFLCLAIFSIIGVNNDYQFKDNFFDNIIFFVGGVIEIFASIVPGISGTSLLMILGIYSEVLKMTASIFNFSYVFNHINIYLSYGLGMFLSFIINTYLINYLLKRHKNTTYSIILGLSCASILFLIVITFKIHFSIIDLIIGIMLLVLGLLLSCILDK